MRYNLKITYKNIFYNLAIKALAFLFIFQSSKLYSDKKDEAKQRWNPTFGVEIEASHEALNYPKEDITLVIERIILRDFNEVMSRHCAKINCVVKSVSLKHPIFHTGYEYIYSNNFKLTSSVDPHVIEVKGKATLGRWRNKLNFLQENFFDLLLANEFTFDNDQSANHISVGMRSTFGDDKVFFKNYLKYLYNRPEFAFGLFNRDLYNSAPISLLTQPSKNELAAILDNGDNTADIEDIVYAIKDDVYTDTLGDPEETTHYQAVNLDKANLEKRSATDELRRLELRFFRGVKSARQLVTQIEFVMETLKYVKNNPSFDEFYTKSNYMGETPQLLAARFAAHLDDMRVTKAKADRFWALLPTDIQKHRYSNVYSYDWDFKTYAGEQFTDDYLDITKVSDLILISPAARLKFSIILAEQFSINSRWTERFLFGLVTQIESQNITNPKVLKIMDAFVTSIAINAKSEKQTAVANHLKEKVLKRLKMHLSSTCQKPFESI